VQLIESEPKVEGLDEVELTFGFDVLIIGQVVFMKWILAVALVVGFVQVSSAKTHQKSGKADSKATPKVYFVDLKNGDKVKSPFVVKMGLEGLKLRDAGLDPDDKKTGHHHILINRGFIPEGQPIPMDETHLHFGKSQSEATVTLPPGEYTLTLQLADGAHRSYGEKLSSSIKVTVEK